MTEHEAKLNGDEWLRGSASLSRRQIIDRINNRNDRKTGTIVGVFEGVGDDKIGWEYTGPPPLADHALGMIVSAVMVMMRRIVAGVVTIGEEGRT